MSPGIETNRSKRRMSFFSRQRQERPHASPYPTMSERRWYAFLSHPDDPAKFQQLADLLLLVGPLEGALKLEHERRLSGSPFSFDRKSQRRLSSFVGQKTSQRFDIRLKTQTVRCRGLIADARCQDRLFVRFKKLARS